MLKKIMDKKKVLERIGQKSIVLELGCGPRKRVPGSIGIDMLDYPAVDIVGDIFDVLEEFPTKSVHGVHSSHFFEHVDDIPKLMKEIERILLKDGVLEITVPHFSNPYFFSDPTHKSFFGLYSMSYFSNSKYYCRQVPTYFLNNFSLQKVDLIFKSAKPFYARYGVKKIIGSIFNSCKFMQEFYEENLCYIFPCYEIKYNLIKNNEQY
jgi:ubiquinone/menaquinone biosynthesis C-methylase UbiE